MTRLAILPLFAAVAFSQLAPEPTRVMSSKTETSAFPSGGVLHVGKSSGELTIEAWDKSDLELTVNTRSKRPVSGDERKRAEDAIGKVKVSLETKGDTISVSTDVPKEHRYKSFDGAPTLFEVDYRIRVPRNARLVVDDHSGEVHIEGVRGDIDARVREGEIALHLPEKGTYAVDARSKFGNVTSDFPGDEMHRWWRTTHFMNATPQSPAQKLKLRVGYGDVVILAERVPAIVAH